MNLRLTLFAVVLFNAMVSDAATITVTSLADSGSGSLRTAVASAASGDTINITATGTITLTSGEIAITKALSISGPGTASLTVSGNNASRIFKVSATTAGAVDAAVAIAGMTLSNGYATGTCPAPTTGSGGAIAATESLTLTNVTISGSQAVRNGGAIAWAMRLSGQQLTLSNVTLSGNSAGCASATAGGNGGALFAGYDTSVASGAAGAVTLTNSAILGNTARRNGGGIALTGPLTLAASASRIVGNTATTAYGGGLYLAHPSVTTIGTPQASFIASEIAENVAALAGGGVTAVNAGSSFQATGNRSAVTFTNTTISNNQVTAATADAAAVSVAGNASLNLRNSTVALNQLTTATTGAALTRSVCTGTVEPLGNVSSSIVAMTNAGASAFNDVSDLGASLSQAWSVGNSLIRQLNATLTGSGNLSGADPLFVALAYNGGTTRTHALQSLSPAINTGSNAFALITDQRGNARTYSAVTDMGALESPFGTATACTFDLDGDGVIAPATDGVMIARLLSGFTGASVTADAVNSNGARPTWASINTYLSTTCSLLTASSTACSFDLDGDSAFNPATDGVMLVRLMQGQTDTAVTGNAVNTGGSRASWSQIKTHLNTYCGYALQ